MSSKDKSTDRSLTHELNMIVATSKNRAIGSNGEIPWHYSEDMKHFRRTTKGHPIIMGRKTYDSIGRPLPKRLNIIVTRNPDLKIDGCVVVNSLEEAIKFANNSSTEVPFIIGGAEIYKMALPKTTRLYLTIVNKECEGDTFFPEIDLDEWELQSSHTLVRPDEVKLYHYTRREYEFNHS